MKYLFWIPAAAMVVGILLSHGLSMKERSAQDPVPAAQGSPDASATPSWAASGSEETAEAQVDSESGNGGDGALSLDTPTSTTTTVATVEDVADSNLPQSSATVQQALKAQLDEQPVRNGEGASSSLARGSNNLEAAIEAAFPPSEWATAYRVAMCESGGDPDAPTGAAGEEGAFQVIPRYHGTVPSDLLGQAQQAAEIVAEAGWSPWTCAR